MKHRIVWFTEQVEGVPLLMGQREEESLTAWDLAEAFRQGFGVNLEAYVPVVDSLDELDPEDLCQPARALEVISAERLEALRSETFKIRDRYGMPREIQGSDVASWLEGYRELWGKGAFVVRTASE